MIACAQNPYDTPEPAPVVKLPPKPAALRLRQRALLAWPLLLLLNLLLPLLFVFIMTNRAGWLGVGLAIGIILLTGYYFCWRHAALAWQTLAGLALLAITQFVPVLQIAAGFCGLMAAGVLGLKGPTVPGQPFIDTVPLGLVIVLVSGAVLLTIAALFGLLLRWIVPARWYANWV